MSIILAYALALESKGKNEEKGEKGLNENNLKKSCEVKNNKKSFCRRILSLFKR